MWATRLKEVLKSNKGQSELLMTAILMPIVFILLFSLILLFIDILSPYIYYAKITDVTRQYISKMEADGGISQSTKEEILNTLAMRGLKVGSIIIQANPDLSYEDPAKYGEVVSFTLTYNLQLKIIQNTGDGVRLGFKRENMTVPIKASNTGISKLTR